MSVYRLPPADVVTEWMEEAAWAQRIADAGGEAQPARISEMDTLLEAISEAHRLCRHFAALLARERGASAACRWPATRPERRGLAGEEREAS